MNINQILEKLFPFHFMIDEKFRIIHAGRSSKKLFPYINDHDQFLDHFEIARPRIDATFTAFTENENTLFVVKTKQSADIEMKAQVIRLSKNVMFFVFTPVITDLLLLKALNITMDDFAIYDTTIEFMFALQATKKSLDDAIGISKELEEKVEERTHELKAKNDEILAQNEEFIQQQDQLNKQSLYLAEKNRKLQRARELIHNKNRELKLHSINLKHEVEQRTQDLIYINSELLNQNNQLEQFAFIVAHNLRAPIARILGLINVLKMEELINEDNEFYIENIHLSTLRLEEVIMDLNRILDIKKGMHHAYEFISLEKKTKKIIEMLHTQLNESNADIHFNFTKADQLCAVSSYVENILYNLISNAIKYRDPEREISITLTTERTDDRICLSIKDTGLGMNLEKNKDNLYKLYKRFHTHVEGKGIGLYMVKTQVDAMGGKIEMETQPGKGTTFKIYFREDPTKVAT
jgi:signal transduction histidine kinase